MDGDAEHPARQFAAAWQAASAAVGEWAQRVSTATHEALDKIEPALHAAVEAGRSTLAGNWRDCRCPCGTAHPADNGVCDGRAVLTRRVSGTNVSMCAPCAVAQGFAEFTR